MALQETLDNIVYKPVRQNREALDYAAPELMGDREIVLEAVKLHWLVYEDFLFLSFES